MNPWFLRLDRAATLERDRAKIIDRVRMLQKKSDADDRLVDALRNELQVREYAGHHFLLRSLTPTNELCLS